MPLSDPIFSTPLDNVSTTVASPRSTGASTLTVATGTGTLFGSPSSSAPVRITIVRKADSARCHYKVTGVSGDVLTIAVIDGYTDISQNVGDTVSVLVSAGTILELQNSDLAIITAFNSQASDTVTLDGSQTVTGAKTFSQTITGNISGQAGTVATINGLIAEGSNVTITGSGTSSSPYTIAASGGGGGTPGGSSASIQYNNSGSFGGFGSVDSEGQVTLGTTSGATPLSLQGVVNQTPVMTGYSTPSPFVASSSSDINVSNEAWMAFDSNASTVWIPSTNTNEYVQLDFGSGNAFACYSYAITAPTTQPADDAPFNWTFKGSNDNSTFTTLDTQSSISFTSGQVQTFVVNSGTAYRYYRLLVAANNGGGNIAIEQLNIFSYFEFFQASVTGTTIEPGVITPTINSNGDSLLVGGSLTCNGATIESFLTYGVFLNFPSTFASGIGSGSNAWIAIAADSGEWFTNSTSGDLAYRNITGRILIGCSSGLSQINVSSNGTEFVSISASTPVVSIEGTSGQSADLQQWQNSSGSPLSGVDPNGCIRTAITSGAPTSTPSQGSMMYDPSSNKLWIYNGSTWKSVTLT